MSEPILQWIIDGTAWTQNSLFENAQSLTEAEFCQQPSPNALPIGWHVWHIARWADILQESMTDVEEYWQEAGLIDTFGLDPSKLGLM